MATAAEIAGCLAGEFPQARRTPAPARPGFRVVDRDGGVVAWWTPGPGAPEDPETAERAIGRRLRAAGYRVRRLENLPGQPLFVTGPHRALSAAT